MIPLKLELTNFLSYRETATLDFGGLHLACISGLNGAGKSSILDSITWVLFGNCRAKSDDDVINRIAAARGEAAIVQFTFQLDGGVYRVVRRKTAGKSLGLEFQLQTDAGWKTLSEGKSRETQDAIEKLLRLNYDTFTNASFLLQGKADEFTTKTANKRKEILADLLGVNQWDDYRTAVAERRKREEGQMLLLESRLREIEEELGQRELREAELAQAQAELADMVAHLTDKEALLAQLRRAEEAAKQQKQLVANLHTALARARQTLESLQRTQAQRQTQRDSYQAILDEAEPIAAAFAAWEQAEAALQGWQEKADQYHALQQEMRPHELTIEREKSRLTQRQTELEVQQGRVAAAATERETVQQNQALTQARLTELDATLATLLEQEKTLQDARTHLQNLENERKLWQQEAGQLQTRQRRIQALLKEREGVLKNRDEANAQLVTVSAQVAALATQRDTYSRALGERDNLLSQQERIKERGTKHNERIAKLQEESGSECPLCGQPLTIEHRHKVLADLEAENQAGRQEYGENQARLKQLTTDIATLEKTLKQSDKLERDQQTQQQRVAAAEARLVEVEQAVTEWEGGEAARLAELEQQLADETPLLEPRQQVKTLEQSVQAKSRLEKEQQDLTRQIANMGARLAEIDRLVAEWEQVGQNELATAQQALVQGAYAQEAQAALKELQGNAAAIQYDPAAHETARQARNALATAPTRHQELRQAEAAVKPLDEALTDGLKQIADQESHITEQTQQYQAAQETLTALEGDSSELLRLEKEVNLLREQKTQADRKTAVLQSRLAVLVERENQQKETLAEKEAQSLLINRLKTLEKACGREGVQALLIEQALPDIEERANILLDRLTNGDMRISFDTQKALKSRKGELRETLEITIVDGAGERPYENYSGGEQFRVNFALRLALSQVLAKRAGARLQTLVIDEGFGSQDPAGRQRLVEAINTIQDDFARILVITHIDELKDAFPNRIEVSKGANGSQITVV